MIKTMDNGLGEKIYSKRLDTGLEVFLQPKKGFQASNAVFATKYGSNDNDFIGIDGKRRIVPEGIAHFLEHKMFDMPNIDVFEEFSKFGVSANAYTNHYMTAYIFSGTKNFRKSLELLLDYVQTPYFTDENVEKEKGIIEQEIKMYDDNPGWKLQLNLFKNMYHNHPVKLDIVGTTDSIYKIDKEDLEICYKTFYHPSNMILYLVGDFNVDEMFDLIQQNQNSKDFPEANEIQKFYPKEPYEVVSKESCETMPVSMPQLAIGYKHESSEDVRELLIEEIVLKIAFDAIIGKSSKLYNDLYNKGLILDDFSFSSSVNNSYSFTILGGATPSPDKLEKLLLKEIKNSLTTCLIAENVERIKKKHIGRYIMGSDNLSGASNNFVAYQVKGMNLADYYHELQNISVDQIIENFKRIVNFDNFSVSKILPLESTSQ